MIKPGPDRLSVALDQDLGSPMCVEAVISEFKSHSKAVTVLLAAGTLNREPSAVPPHIRVTITENGVSRPVRHLGDLPAELNHPAPRLPRDLPVPAGAPS